MDGGARSKPVRVERLALSARVVGQDAIDQIFEFGFVVGSRAGPPRVVIELGKQELREPVLLTWRHGTKPNDRLFHQSSHGGKVRQVAIRRSAVGEIAARGRLSSGTVVASSIRLPPLGLYVDDPTSGVASGSSQGNDAAMRERQHAKQRNAALAAVRNSVQQASFASRKSTAQLAPGRSSWRDVAGAVALAAVTLVAFGRLFSAKFTAFDDISSIVDNPQLHAPLGKALDDAWTRPFISLYIPVTQTLWILLAKLSGDPLDPAVFHAANVVCHALAAMVLFFLLARLVGNRWAALTGAALFAVHPLQVEPVAWASGLKDVLCGLLSLVAMWQFVAWLDEDRSRTARRNARLAAASCAFLLALLSKPSAMSVPLICWTLGMVHTRAQAVRRISLAAGAWSCAAVVVGAYTRVIQPGLATDAGPLWARPLIAGDALCFYLGKLLWPWPMGIDYGRNPAHVLAGKWADVAWTVPAAVAVLLWRFRRRVPLIAAGGAMFVLAVAPVLGFVRFDWERVSIVADHYLYVAIAGVALAVSATLAKLRSRAMWLASGVLLLVFSVASVIQAGYWRDSLSLLNHAVWVNPTSSISYENIAWTYNLVSQGAPAEAAARKALELEGDYPLPQTVAQLARAVELQGKNEEAQRWLLRCIELGPPTGIRVQCLTKICQIDARAGRLDDAIRAGEEAVRLLPDELPTRAALAFAYGGAGRWPQAVEQSRALVRLAPQEPASHGMLAEALEKVGDLRESQAEAAIADRLEAGKQRSAR